VHEEIGASNDSRPAAPYYAARQLPAAVVLQYTRTGRPLGDETFLARLEGMVGRVLKPQKRGPKPKEKVN
jgi:hypothetical protein